MKNRRRAVGIDQWMIAALQTRHRDFLLQRPRAAGRDDEVRQIAHMMALRRLRPVLAAGRVPMRAGRCEIGLVALADAMKMKAVAARLQAADRRIHHQAIRCLRRSEEHTSELQSLMRISYAVFCLKTKTTQNNTTY